MKIKQLIVLLSLLFAVRFTLAESHHVVASTCGLPTLVDHVATPTISFDQDAPEAVQKSADGDNCDILTRYQHLKNLSEDDTSLFREQVTRGSCQRTTYG